MAQELAKLVRMDAARLTAALSAKDPRKPPVVPIEPPRRMRPLAPVAPGGRGSVVRQAVRVLVHHPCAAQKVTGSEGLENVDRPGIPLLIELLNDLQENPCANTAALLERWRGRPDFEHLARLAGTDYPVDAEGATRELAGALSQLYPAGAEKRLEELLKKQGREGLTDAERIELQGFLTVDGASPLAPR
jgi:DNA primase